MDDLLNEGTDMQGFEGAFSDDESIANSSLTYRIYHVIKEDILFGRLEPGEKLNAVKLAQQYNVSRTPVKHALELLERDTLVSMEPGKRAVVMRPSAKEVIDIYLFRRQLEPLAAKLSVKYVPVSELNELKRQLKTLQLNPKLYRAQIEFDRQLHTMLWEHIETPMIPALFRVLNDYSARVQSFIISTVNKDLAWASENNAEHLAIIDAILERDGEKAKRAVQQHLNRSCERLLSFYGRD